MIFIFSIMVDLQQTDDFLLTMFLRGWPRLRLRSSVPPCNIIHKAASHVLLVTGDKGLQTTALTTTG